MVGNEFSWLPVSRAPALRVKVRGRGLDDELGPSNSLFSFVIDTVLPFGDIAMNDAPQSARQVAAARLTRRQFTGSLMAA
ncbi:MAG: hypothetical protein ACYC6N_30680, partial [Pirellulaceae bacterium]